MDSLDLNNLANSLPSSTIARAEQETMDKFKAAAQSLTLLYRSSQKAAKRHFDAGYATALEDLLSVIQHGVSASADSTLAESSEGISISRILDWIEARQESIRIKAREEEEDEEERDNRNRSGLANKPALPALRTSGAVDVRDKTKARSPSELPVSSPPIPSRRPPDIVSTTAITTMHNPNVSAAAAVTTSPRPESPSQPSPTLSPVVQPSIPSFPSSMRFRSRPRSQYTHSPLSAASANSNHNTNTSITASPSVTSLLGAKRRHAAMLLDAYPPPSATVSLPSSDFGTTSAPISIFNPSTRPSDGVTPGAGFNAPGGQRRRLRNSRTGVAATRSENTTPNDSHGPASTDTIMDVEEEGGRERKRVARR